MRWIRKSLLLLCLAGALLPCAAFARAALIVIDMQAYFVTRGGNAENGSNPQIVHDIIQKQIAAVKLARAAHAPIVFIEYAGDYGETNDELKKAAEGYPEVAYIKKDTDGMLDPENSHREELLKYLHAHGVDALLITGANGGACVERSIDGALSAENHFSVTAYSKGIADFNFENFIYPYKYDADPCSGRSDCRFRQVDKLDDAKDLFYSAGDGQPAPEVPGDLAPAK